MADVAKRQKKVMTTAAVEKMTGPAKVLVERGLWLKVSPNGSKSWTLRYMKAGRAHELGLGRYPEVGLESARAKAATIRSALADGNEPVSASSVIRPSVDTFDDRADAFVALKGAGWGNAKHRAQWESTLRTYASPVIGRMPVDQITTVDVLKILKPIWSAKPETASRLRGRIEAVLDSATALGMRSGPNPARWAEGGLKQLLPPRAKVRRVKHHAAMHYDDLRHFMARLRKQPGVAAKALAFLILTAARTGEVIGARWSEIDMKAKTWVIPAKRMKAGRGHRIPLSLTAIETLKELGGQDPQYVFPSPAGGPLSNMAMLVLLQAPDRMNMPNVTVHGFRSAFSDWASEISGASTAIVEASLAHAVANAVEAAYRRGDLFTRRRALMADWERHLLLG